MDRPAGLPSNKKSLKTNGLQTFLFKRRINHVIR